MIYSIIIDGVDVREFGLFVESRTVPLPDPKTTFVTVPGANGTIDLSTALTDGDMKFGDRPVTVKLTGPGDYNANRDRLARLLHGREVRLTFTDDPEHYFFGRAEITSWGVDKAGLGEFTIAQQAHPYRYLHQRTRVEFTADGSVLNLPNRRMWTHATFTASAPMSVAQDGTVWSLTAGVPRTIRDLVLREGDNPLAVSGAGKIVIEYQEGEL